MNREPMLDVIRMHRDAMRGIKPEHVQTELFMAAQESWDTALNMAKSMASRIRKLPCWRRRALSDS